jgi:hypothetical protein
VAWVLAAVALVAVRPGLGRGCPCVSGGEAGGGRLSGELGRRCRALGRLGRRCRARGGIQPFGGGASGGGLGGVPLGVAEFGDGFCERGQPG